MDDGMMLKEEDDEDDYAGTSLWIYVWCYLFGLVVSRLESYGMGLRLGVILAILYVISIRGS